MPTGTSGLRAARTLLEQKIRERRETFEEFAEYAERFAREHNEPGTLSVRHLHRLASGRNPDGSPLGPLRPATSRLLERIFSLSADDLLRPTTTTPNGVSEAEPLRVAVAVVPKNHKVLIVCRRDNQGARLSWQFPAGIVKPGMPSESTAVHETYAETAVHCRVTQNLGGRLHPITNVYCHYLLCEYLHGNATNVDAIENLAVAWVDASQLTQYIPSNYIYQPIRYIMNRSVQTISTPHESNL